MKRILHIIDKITTVFSFLSLVFTFFFLIIVVNSFGQTYNMPGGTINTCSGSFYDGGGSATDYGNGQNVTTTFCSNAGSCVRVTFSSFSTESGYDYLYIYDGPTTGSTLIGTYSGTTSPGTVTSTTGCLTFRFTSDGSVTSSGWAAVISCVACPPPTYNMPGGTINTCSGNFYDTGGNGAAYGNSQNITTTFCSNAGSCVQVVFTSFSTESGYDYLYIYDGPSTASPLIGTYSGTTSPGTVTSTTGCLTFRFTSDGSVTSTGWIASISCVSCAACTTPGTPTTLSGSATGQTTANISWAAGVPAGSATVTYYWEVHNAAETVIASGSTTSLSAGVTGLTCNTTYHLHVRAYTSCNATYSAWAGPSATFTTNACVGGPCGAAIGIAGCGAGNSQSFSLSGAGAWNTSYCGFSLPGNEQVYSYVAPLTGTYNIQVTASTGGYVDYGWQASSCASTGWTCIDDVNTTGTYGPISWTAGTTYYLLLDGEATSVALTGTFYITCPVAAPANNNCPGTVLTPGATCSWTAGTTLGATETLAGCAGTANDDVWYSFVATQANHVIDVDGNGDFDAVVELFSGNCGSLNSITCMDLSLGGGVESIDATGLTIGNTYYIRVYHYSATNPTNSTFSICVYNYADICGDFICGPTESCGTCPGDCGSCPEPVGGPYIHGTDGLQGTYVANCMANTCSGSYYDAGGAAGNYPNNEGNWATGGGWYRTFCPTSANQCLTATINALDIENSAGGCYDYLVIRNGSTQNSPILWAGCRTLATPRTIAGVWANPQTGSSSNGCLTFEFYSDNTGVRAGWNISFSCSACVTSPDNNDCQTATPVCGAISFAGFSDGPGLTSTCSGCVLSENYTNWYYFEVASSGRLSMTIDPIATDDYDFALYEASNCASLGSPVRCSYAMNTAGTGWNTGMDVAYSDVSEDVTGDAWVDALNVTAGQTYFLMINNWSPGGSGFNITGNMTEGGALVDCGLLPIDLVSFDAYKKDRMVELKWVTSSETNNDYFTVLKSYDANFYKQVATVFSAGNTNTETIYSVLDEEPLMQTTYYRLKQTDKDGKFSYSDVKVVTPSNYNETLNSLNAYFVNNTQEIVVSFNGIPENVYGYIVYDITGRPVKIGSIKASCSAKGNAVIRTADISQGIYSIVLNDKQTVLQQKLIITK